MPTIRRAVCCWSAVSRRFCSAPARRSGPTSAARGALARRLVGRLARDRRQAESRPRAHGRSPKSGGATSTTRCSISWWPRRSASTPACAPRACASWRRAPNSASPAAPSIPQLQQVSGEAVAGRTATVRRCRTRTSPTYGAGLDIGWELDFWGKFRRGIEAADADYFASIAQYDDVQVLVAAQVASLYTTIRTIELRLRIAQENAALQKRSLEITERLFKSGNESELDVQQARALYLGTLATIPELEAACARPRTRWACCSARPPGPLPEMAAGTRADSGGDRSRSSSTCRPTCCAAGRTSARPRCSWPRSRR